MASSRLNGIADSGIKTRLPAPDSPVGNRQEPNANDSDDSEVIINRHSGRRRQNRSREMVNTPRTELNSLYD